MLCTSPEAVKQMLKVLSRHSIGCLTIGESAAPLDLDDAVLEIGEGGAWTWKELRF